MNYRENKNSEKSHVNLVAMAKIIKPRIRSACTPLPRRDGFLWDDPVQDKRFKNKVHQRNRGIHSGHGLVGNFELNFPLRRSIKARPRIYLPSKRYHI